ncbi:bactofilin family protein [Lutispora thermophila]|uniref:Polymer-forming protein n=1 Tax=Lutispora thermophila DSM 19022 TaxID=1122184 RepID=A0A1M6B879_9FIRM|nr:polymer-forming cytoskeletal protein [Lutispora thermophila]SHI44857.1 Polymer-forming protein [Lutispora thermophila DSM 19022]
MFTSNKKTTTINTDKIDTLIGKNTGIEGTLTAEGTVRIDGKMKGDVTLLGNLIVGEDGSIKGNIKADSVILSGIVEGNVTVENHLHITSTAKLIGDINAKNIVIDEGAIFNGNCRMDLSIAKAEAAATKDTKDTKETKGK